MNMVMLMGRLTRDVELRHTQSGTAVASTGLAVNRKRGDKEEVLFVDLTLWGKTAENFAKFFRKGKGVVVCGRLGMDEWEQDGKKRTKIFVTVEEWSFPLSEVAF